jgi:uncharacterized OsmC-like protein
LNHIDSFCLYAGDHFTKDPEAARITMQAQAHLDSDGTCMIDNRSGDQVRIHRALGGDGTTACSGDILLESLVACTGVTLRQIATAMDIKLQSAVIRAEGDLDFRGSLGLSNDVPVGIERIRLHFDLDTDANAQDVRGLIRLTQRYCVVSRTLTSQTDVTYSAR